MISFVDGPARGKHLMLARAPMFLRVVRSTTSGNWDALDQLSDTPKSDEEIYVYQLIDEPSVAFVDFRDKRTGKRRGCMTQIGRYRYCAEQPSEEVARQNHRWAEWCKQTWQQFLEHSE